MGEGRGRGTHMGEGRGRGTHMGEGRGRGTHMGERLADVTGYLFDIFSDYRDVFQWR